MKSQKFWVAALAVAVAVVISVYLWKTNRAPQVPPPLVVEKQPVPQQPQTPTVLNPLPAQPKASQAEPEKPLPGLEQSDGTVRQGLGRLFPLLRLDTLLNLDHFIQRFVLMVDSLPRPELPANRLPTKPVPGSFLTTQENGALVISAANYRRYTPYVQLAETVDTQKLVALYIRLYPLFQKAYQNLGYPHGYFNDRLIEVIDHLLTTPQVTGPIRVVQHVVRYQYADPQLEQLSAGQKILLRMGPDNAAKVMAKLREIRQALTSRQPGSGN